MKKKILYQHNCSFYNQSNNTLLMIFYYFLLKTQHKNLFRKYSQVYIKSILNFKHRFEKKLSS